MTETIPRLLDAFFEPPNEQGDYKMTKEVLGAARDLVCDAESKVQTSGSGHPVVTSDGGVRITWKSVDRFSHVVLAIPADDKDPYVYSRIAGEMPVIDTVGTLAKHLEKL